MFLYTSMQDRTDHYRALLDTCIEAGANIIRILNGEAEAHTQARTAEAEASPAQVLTPLPDIAAAYTQVHRAVRLGILLAQSLDQDPKPTQAAATPPPAPAPRRAVEYCIQRKTEPAEATRLHAELRERLDTKSLNQDVPTRPPERPLNTPSATSASTASAAPTPTSAAPRPTSPSSKPPPLKAKPRTPPTPQPGAPAQRNEGRRPSPNPANHPQPHPLPRQITSRPQPITRQTALARTRQTDASFKPQNQARMAQAMQARPWPRPKDNHMPPALVWT